MAQNTDMFLKAALESLTLHDQMLQAERKAATCNLSRAERAGHAALAAANAALAAERRGAQLAAEAAAAASAALEAERSRALAIAEGAAETARGAQAALEEERHRAALAAQAAADALEAERQRARDAAQAAREKFDAEIATIQGRLRSENAVRLWGDRQPRDLPFRVDPSFSGLYAPDCKARLRPSNNSDWLVTIWFVTARAPRRPSLSLRRSTPSSPA